MRLVYTDGLYCISIYGRFLGPTGREQEQVRTVGQGLIASRSRAGRETVVVADLPEVMRSHPYYEQEIIA